MSSGGASELNRRRREEEHEEEAHANEVGTGEQFVSVHRSPRARRTAPRQIPGRQAGRQAGRYPFSQSTGNYVTTLRYLPHPPSPPRRPSKLPSSPALSRCNLRDARVNPERRGRVIEGATLLVPRFAARVAGVVKC